MAQHNIVVRQEEGQVILFIDGREIRLPWNIALDVAAILRQKAKLAEEYANAAGIIFDQALLMRLGIPIGLTSNPVLQHEAALEAATNRDLRRYLPGGIRSEEHVGTPKLIRHRKRS